MWHCFLFFFFPADIETLLQVKLWKTVISDEE